MTNDPSRPDLTAAPLARRRVFGLAAGAVAGAAVLSACGDSGEGGESSAQVPVPTPTGTFTTTDKIPVDGGAIFPDEKIVVTQPEDGHFEAFSAVCTHQGCLVSSVDKDGIHCSCHGSTFALKDGAVLHGPASSPLAQVPLKVKGDDITLG